MRGKKLWSNPMSLIVAMIVVMVATFGWWMMRVEAGNADTTPPAKPVVYPVTDLSSTQGAILSTIGGSNFEEWNGIASRSTGGYVTVGYFYSLDGDLTSIQIGSEENQNAWIASYDTVGNLLWKKSLGGSGSEYYKDVAEGTDGSFVAVGKSNSIDGDLDGLIDGYTRFNEALIVKYSSDGQLVWKKTFGTYNGEDIFHAVVATADGGFVAAGESGTPGPTGTGTGDLTGITLRKVDALLVKFDKDGNVVWRKTFGGAEYDYFKGLAIRADGSFVAVGSTSSPTGDFVGSNHGGGFSPLTPNPDAMIFQFDASGNMLNSSLLGGTQSEEFKQVTVTSDGSVYAVGSTNSWNGDLLGVALMDTGMNGIVAKYNGAGTLLWVKSIGGTNDDTFAGVTATSDGGVVAVGSSNSSDGIFAGEYKGNYDAIIVQLNTNGQIISVSCIGGSNNMEAFNSVTTNLQGGVVAVGGFLSTDGIFDGRNNGWLDGFLYGSPYTYLTVTGTAEANSIVKIVANKQLVGSGIANQTGEFSIRIPALPNGTKLSITATDAAGNKSVATVITISRYIDPPVVNPLTDAMTTISGTASAGLTITVQVGEIELGTTQVNSNGIYRLTMNKQLAGTEITVIASAKDGSVSSPTTVIVTDATPPNPPIVSKISDVNTWIAPWIVSFGGQNYDEFFDVITLPDEQGFLAVGATNSADQDLKQVAKANAANEALLVKYDVSGNVLWKKAYGGKLPDSFTSVTLTSDQNFGIVGSSSSTDGDFTGVNKGKSDAIVFKCSPTGTLLWQKSFGGSNEDAFTSVIATADGGLLAVGQSDSIDGDLANVGGTSTASQGIVVRYDSNGNVLWKKAIGGSGNEYFYDVAKSKDNLFILVGMTNSPTINGIANKSPISALNYDALLMNIDADGQILWTQLFGGTGYDVWDSVALTIDDQWVAGGMSNSANGDMRGLHVAGNGYSALLLKFTTDGAMVWKKTIGGAKNDSYTGVAGTLDGGVIAVGRSDSVDQDWLGLNKGSDDGILVQYDRDGKLLSKKMVGGSGSEWFNSVALSSDGGYATVGMFTSNNADFLGLRKGYMDAMMYVAGPTMTTISGTAEKGAQVEVRLNQELLASVYAGDDQKFQWFVPHPTAGQVFTFTATDASQNTSATRIVTVSSASTPLAVESVSDNSTAVTGTAIANSRMSVQAGDVTLGSAKAGLDGKFRVTMAKQPAGTWLTIEASENNSLTQPPLRIQVTDGTPPLAPVVNSVDDRSTQMSGNAEAGSTVIVKKGSTTLGSALANEQGAFQLTIAKQLAGVTLTVTATDVANNSSPAVQVVVLDRTLPAAPVLDPVSSIATARVAFAKLYGGENSDQFNDIIATRDGAYVAVGQSNSTAGAFLGMNKGGIDAVIVKFDLQGNLIWQKSFGGTGQDTFTRAVTNTDGSVLVVGSTTSTNGDLAGLTKGTRNALLVKYSANGEIVWKKVFGGTSTQSDEFTDIALDASGNIVAVGSSNSTTGDLAGLNKGSQDGIIVLFDASGNVLWKKTFGGSQADAFQAVTVKADSFTVVGYSASTDQDMRTLGKGNHDAIIVKYTTTGNVSWKRAFGGSGDDRFLDIQLTLDSAFVAVGYSESTNGDLTGLAKGGRDAIIARYTDTGNRNLVKVFGGEDADEFTAITLPADGSGYWLVGSTLSTKADLSGLNKGGRDGLMVKYTPSWSVQSTKTVGGSANDTLSGIIDMRNGGYLAVGASRSTNGDVAGITRFAGDDAMLYYSDWKTMTVTGIAEKGSLVNIYASINVLNQGIANNQGKFSIVIPAQIANTVLTANATDAAGNTSPTSATVTVK